MKERELIEVLRRPFPPPPGRRNSLFTADAEVAARGEELTAYTVDEFSGEDGLSLDDPRLLGRNLVAATLSDLLAVGARPRWLLDSLVLPPAVDRETVTGLARGLREGLEEFDAHLLGGDMGTAPEWRFTGVGIGDYPPGGEPLHRIVPPGEGVILATGRFGDGNLAAGLGGPPPGFECRLPQARLLAGTGCACIDTSDGLAAALETICRLNRGLAATLEMERIPYAPGLREAAARAGVPLPAFLLGSAGEYELLAFLPAQQAAGLEEQGSFRRLGTYRRTDRGGLHLQGSRGSFLLPELPDPREATDREAYRRQVIDLARTAAERTG